MITRTTFIKLLDALQAQFEFDRSIGKSIDKLSVADEDGPINRPFSFVTPINSVLVDALQHEMRDEYHNISYYIYDTEFGAKADELFITRGDGTKVKFYTAGHVYDYLAGIHEAGDVQ